MIKYQFTGNFVGFYEHKNNIACIIFFTYAAS